MFIFPFLISFNLIIKFAVFIPAFVKSLLQAINLAPAFAGFIEFKEKQLGKEAKYFNELEKYQILDEFKKMYYKANELLNKGI